MSLTPKEVLRNQILAELLALDNEASLASSDDLKNLTVSVRSQLDAAKTIDELQNIFDFVIKTRQRIITTSVKSKLKLWEQAQILFGD